MTEFLHRLRDCPEAKVAVGHVAGNQHASTAFLLDGAPRNRSIGMFVEIDYRNIGAFSRKQYGDRAPYAGISAGNDRYGALEFLRTDVKRRVIHRRRIKLNFLSGFGLMLFGKWWLRIVARARLHGFGYFFARVSLLSGIATLLDSSLPLRSGFGVHFCTLFFVAGFRLPAPRPNLAG